jgi:hypothetical protein
MILDHDIDVMKGIYICLRRNCSNSHFKLSRFIDPFSLKQNSKHHYFYLLMTTSTFPSAGISPFLYRNGPNEKWGGMRLMEY